MTPLITLVLGALVLIPAIRWYVRWRWLRADLPPIDVNSPSWRRYMIERERHG